MFFYIILGNDGLWHPLPLSKVLNTILDPERKIQVSVRNTNNIVKNKIWCHWRNFEFLQILNDVREPSVRITYNNYPTKRLRVRLARRETGLSPPVRYFTDRSKAVLLLWITCVIYVLWLSYFRVCSLLSCGHVNGRGWHLGSCLWCLLWFCFFPIWYPWTSVVLDCIDSWSFLSFLLSYALKPSKTIPYSVVLLIEIKCDRKCKWVWSGYTTITLCRTTKVTVRKSHRTLTVKIHQKDT